MVCRDYADSEVVARLLAGEGRSCSSRTPPYGIQVGSEWGDRAGLGARDYLLA